MFVVAPALYASPDQDHARVVCAGRNGTDALIPETTHSAQAPHLARLVALAIGGIIAELAIVVPSPALHVAPICTFMAQYCARVELACSDRSCVLARRGAKADAAQATHLKSRCIGAAALAVVSVAAGEIDLLPPITDCLDSIVPQLTFHVAAKALYGPAVQDCAGVTKTSGHLGVMASCFRAKY